MSRPLRDVTGAGTASPLASAAPLRPGAGPAFAIAADGLVKRFGNVNALDGIGLRVPYGSVLALLGPNGSGKTTTVRILTTVLAPDAGRVIVAGIDAVKSPGHVRPLIGMAGQYAAVDPNLTGRENLVMVGRLAMLPRRAARRRANELIGDFALQEVADRPSRTYSGGTRRRLDLAAALVHSPGLLFFDEPTTGLDPHSRRALWAVVQRLAAAGTTVVLTTQYLDEADRLADKVAVLNRGKVIAQGTPAQLKARFGTCVAAAEFAGAGAAAQAVHVLSPHHRAAQRDNHVEIPVLGSEPALTILTTLQAHGLAPRSFVIREPSLDDVFCELTGHAAGGPPTHRGTT